MKKKDIVRSKLLFNEIINRGQKISNKYYVLYSEVKEEQNSNFGIAVGKKVGNAVTRNKIKRRIRNIIDKNQKSLPYFHNYIIICKKEILKLKFQDMEKELIKLFKKGENK